MVMITQGEIMEGRDKLGDWGWHIHTAICKIESQ